jgi:hypothetical protein
MVPSISTLVQATTAVTLYQLLTFIAVCVSHAAVSPDARPIVGAVVGAAVAAGVVYAGVQAKQKRDGAAVIDLYNYIVEVGFYQRGFSFK